MKARAKLAADIGGTFTDIVLEDGLKRWSGKVLTTTHAPELGVIEGIHAVLEASGLKPQDIGVFIHGTTLATNALIERKGAKTGLLTTAGFEDGLEIGRERKYELYDIFIEMPKPLVPRPWLRGARERIGPDGAVALDRPENRDALAFVARLAGIVPPDTNGAMVTELSMRGWIPWVTR